jgi:hypothetical protein
MSDAPEFLTHVNAATEAEICQDNVGASPTVKDSDA